MSKTHSVQTDDINMEDIEDGYTLTLVSSIAQNLYRNFTDDDEETEEIESDTDDSLSEIDDNHRNSGCPVYYYTHTCLVCQKELASLKKLKKHITTNNHQISDQITKILDIIKKPEPQSCTPKIINGVNTEDFNDPITKELTIDPVILPCGHLIGMKSLNNYINNELGQHICPVCCVPFNKNQTFGICKIIAEHMQKMFPIEIERVRFHLEWAEAQDLYKRFEKYLEYKKQEMLNLQNYIYRMKKKITDMEKLIIN